MTIDTAAFVRQLDLEVAALRAFIELLRTEQAALVRGDTDVVASFVEPKAQHLFNLTRLDEARGRLLAGAGAQSKTEIENLLRKTGGAAAALKAWQGLLQLAETARQVNSTNGLLITSRLQNTQRALSSLFSVARLPGAYGADGGTVSLRTTQQLAVA